MISQIDYKDIHRYARKSSKMYVNSRIKYQANPYLIIGLIERHKTIRKESHVTSGTIKAAIDSYYIRGHYTHPDSLTKRIKIDVDLGAGVTFKANPETLSSFLQVLDKVTGAAQLAAQNLVFKENKPDYGDKNIKPLRNRIMSYVNYFISVFSGFAALLTLPVFAPLASIPALLTIYTHRNYVRMRKKSEYQVFFKTYYDVMKNGDVPKSFKDGEFMTAWKEVIDVLNEYEKDLGKFNKDFEKGRVGATPPHMNKRQKTILQENLLYMKEEMDTFKKDVKQIRGLHKKIAFIQKHIRRINK